MFGSRESKYNHMSQKLGEMSSLLIILNLQSSQIPSGLSVSLTPHILQSIFLFLCNKNYFKKILENMLVE